MGITGFSLDLLNKHNLTRSGLKVLELGCQNLYNNENYGEVSNPYFKAKGQDIDSIDLEGCNDSSIVNLDNPIDKDYINKYDVVTNFGTSEHCEDLYQTFKNIYDACRVGGIIVNENPKTGNWPGHGNHYLTTLFYKQYAQDMGLVIVDIGEHAAMGNKNDGWNVFCVLKKSNKVKFVSRETFENYTYFES